MKEKKKSILTDSIVEKSIDKVLDFVREMTEKSQEEDEERKMEKEEKWKEEKERVKKEFNRVCDIMKDTDTTTEKYKKLSDALYQLKRIMDYWI